MRSQLPRLAEDLRADERTLRRAVADGMIRCHRPSVRRLELAAGERNYLRGHWPLLSALRQALRTEPNVRLAVLYGSCARGHDDSDSDVDLLVSLGEHEALAVIALARRLGTGLGRDVDVVPLDSAWTSPTLLLQILDEGRVIVDRDQQWPGLRGQRRAIVSRARRAHTEEMAATGAAIRDLTRD